ncbi:MAG: phosphate transport system permease protein [Verrucomicrobiales bacterium]|jgi:phosphate transport system permease protein
MTRVDRTDRLMAGVFWAMALIVASVFFWIVGTIVWNGASAISWEFLTDEPENSGRSGGIGPILVSTGLILLVAMAVSLPVGIGTAILLAEFTRGGHWFGRLVRRSLDVLAGVPSIVFGLFGTVFFCQVLGLGFSIWAGGLTLACMVLPILIRASEEGLRAIPDHYRLSAAALGISRTTTLFKLLLPAALPGLMVGFVLGLGRAAAETAALLFTSGYVDRQPESLSDSGRAMTVHIYELAMNVSGGNQNAYGTALVLVSLLLLTNYLANFLARKWLGRRIVY